MRTSRVLIIVAASIAAYAMSVAASAQQPASRVPAPPKLEKLEEVEAPAVTIRGADSARDISQKREQGKVTAVKVKSGDSTYYLKPNTPAGSALPGDAQSDTMRAAQWQVLEFDWSRDAERARQQAAQSAAVPPPPAVSAAPAKKK